MSVLLFIAGLIFTLAGSHWFSGAHTLGVILLVAGATCLIVQLVIFLGALFHITKR